MPEHSLADRAAPPSAPRTPVTDVYHGVRVTDPYRWMEEDTAGLCRWTEGQQRYCADVLAAMPDWAERRRRVAGLTAVCVDVVNVQVGGERLFYLKRDADAAIHRLMVTARDGGAERLVVDPSHGDLGDAHHRSIDWYTVSPDGRFVAYAISRDGSEQATLRVRDLMADSPTEIEKAAAAASRMTRLRYPGVAWSPDSRSFVYQQLTAPTGTAKYQNVATALCEVRLDGAAGSSSEELPRAVAAIAEIPLGPDDTPIVSFSRDGGWLVVGVRSGCVRTCPVYLRRIGSEVAGWQRVADAAIAWQVDGDDVYLLEPGPHGRGRLSRCGGAGRASAVVLADGGHVIEDFCVGPDEVLLRCLDGGRSLIQRLDLGTGRVHPVDLPHDGHVTEWAYDDSTGELVVGLASWTHSLRLLRSSVVDGGLGDTGRLPPAPAERADVISTRVAVRASDGTSVPMTIVHRRDQPLDGSARAVLVGYGYFGISLRAAFQPALVSWIADGNVWAIAHVRGGGEGGERWAEAGHGTGQHRTVDDLLDCADQLVAAGWTSGDRLAAEGTSAGGLTVAGAMLRRPDRFAAVVLRVPVTNTLRLEMHENGPPNIPEYGTVGTAEGLAALLASDVCHQVAAGVRYPPVLVTMGRNDPRVTAFQPAKFVAHLQHASASGQPVLLRVADDAGHGPGSTRTQLDDELADRLTFLGATLADSPTRRPGATRAARPDEEAG